MHEGGARSAIARRRSARIRIERDSLGARAVPADALYGIFTQRARETFHLSGRPPHPALLRAYARIKRAAALANARLGVLPTAWARAIARAADRVIAGEVADAAAIDALQAGAGTPTHMNINEVIANLANEQLGGRRGRWHPLHPNNHVNRGQSSNDVTPTALRLMALELSPPLLDELSALVRAFRRLARRERRTLKPGRTHLQDAVPITLGQEFSGYASVIRHGIVRIENTRPHLSELPIGGTAVGTGLNAHPEFAPRVVAELRALTGHLFRRAENAFEAMQNKDACVELSAALKIVAVGLMKIANDLRLLTSGARTGLNEIELPATQPGSSIMPGKVNPVIPEAVNMVAACVIGHDTTIALAAMNGNLDLNVMMPVIADALLESLDLMGNTARVLAEKCVHGIRANREQCRVYAERSAALVTALAPAIGYDLAAQLFKQALAEDKPIRQVVLEAGALPPEKLDEILDLEKLTRGGRA